MDEGAKICLLKNLCGRHLGNRDDGDAVEILLAISVLAQFQEVVGGRATGIDVETRSRIVEIQLDEDLLTDVDFQRIAREADKFHFHS